MKQKILFYSTNNNSPKVDFEHALLEGLAPDKGLYMPDYIPQFEEKEIKEMKELSYPEIAFQVINKFLDLEEEKIKEIVEDAYNFAVPIEKVDEINYIMRLDQGPTASFKDFAARLMARLIQYYIKKQEKEITILVATSGDTGSAVAQAFYGLENIKVVVLFPKDEVSLRQRKQMTTLGNNVIAISVEGKFDDCQAMVKKAFSDEELKGYNLSSANSINFGRLLPQSIYYFYAYSQILAEKINFCIPSGNFGNMMGGVLAKNMGLPINKFIIAVNDNDEFPKFYNTDKYEKIEPSKNSLSNAMNVGHPSNIARLVAIYGGQMDETGKINKLPDMQKLRNDIFTMTVTDEMTKTAIKKMYDDNKIILEPHGAVAWYALDKYRDESRDETVTVCIETAHPAKFPDEIIKLIGIDPELPLSLKNLEEKEENMLNMKSDYKELKEILKILR